MAYNQDFSEGYSDGISFRPPQASRYHHGEVDPYTVGYSDGLEDALRLVNAKPQPVEIQLELPFDDPR